MACLRNRDKKPTEDFENFHESKKPARIHTTHKHRCRRPCGRSGNRKKFQEEIHSEYDENEAEKNGCDVRDVFHDLGLDYLHQIEWRFSPLGETKLSPASDEFSLVPFEMPLFLQTTSRIRQRAGYGLAPSYCSGRCHTTDCKPTRR